MEILLFKDKVQLKKFPGKGGWTYAALPGVKKDKHNYFGWIEVRGSIDDYAFSNYKLTSLKNGDLFLPVKAAVRKIIKKEEGQYVQVELYRTVMTHDIKHSLMECLQDEPQAESFYKSLSNDLQQKWIEWIDLPLNEDIRIERIGAAVNKLLSKISTPE